MRNLPVLVAQHDGQPVALDLFSGSGRWSAAWRFSLATICAVFELDIRWHLKNDLLSSSVQSRIRGWIRSGLICAVWMGTPCNSFSRARDRPGGPPPLRSDDCPNGLPGLAPHDEEKVRVGNILARFPISIFQCCAHLQVPATIENPETSRLWKLESFQAVRLTKHVAWTSTDFCQDCTPWRKRTAFLSTQLHHVTYTPDERDRSAPFVRSSLMQAAMRRCDGDNKNCSRSHRPHQLLRGIQPSTGRFFTIVAEPYPRGLCRRLVQAYTQAINTNKGDHILPRLWSGMSDGYGNRVNKDFSPRDTTGSCKFGSQVCYCANQCG